MADRTRGLAVASGGPEVEGLHLSLRRLGVEIPAHEIEGRAFGTGTEAAVREAQRRMRLPQTGVVDASTAAAIDAAARAAAAPGQSVSGRAYLEDGRVAKGIPVHLYGRGFGGAEIRLGEASTDDEGFYAIPYEGDRGAAGIELRTPAEGERELTLTETRYDVEANELMNVVVPASVQPLEAEFDRLAQAVAGELEDLGRLGEARESKGQRDLTLLRQATGWDARIVGLAASATRLSKETRLPSEALYGLFRAGLPTEPAKLAQLPAETVVKALAKVKDAGVIGMSDAAVKEVRGQFEEFATERRRAGKAAGTGSPLGELLGAAPVKAEDRDAFERVLFEGRGKSGDLWERAREGGVSEEGIGKLQVQGKLAFLTLNNAPLTKALQGEIGSTDDLERLVDMGLYSPDAWKERIRAVSGGGAALDAAIPPAYVGAKPTERLDAYAADMARKVRLSFPTQVIGKMVASEEIALPDARVRTGVASFLRQAPAKGFELGRTPVGRFVREHGQEILGNLATAGAGRIVEGVKTLDRLWQITPSDHALQTLLGLGFKSAFDVTKFDHRDFVEHFGGRFLPGEAGLVHKKSEQVASVTYTFYGAAKQIDAAPPVFGAAPAPDEVEKAKNELLKQYPTMESLFGSLDFCECEHCRSVLSPAAYLVDLLEFVNPDQLLWDAFLGRWKEHHNNQAYPHGKPYAALIERRPDLANLPLTCENTNTALPYIDVVNEILEHYVADGAPKAHDTGQATTPELLAEPQNVLATAYGQLQTARYPVGLPFDLWTETVRAFFDHFQTPLWRALRMFRPAETTAAWTEQLGLTPVEHALFTGPGLSSKWWELYGHTSAASAKSDLASAKRLSRRLGVTYKQLIELVTGSFVNPRLHALAVLRKLDIEVIDVFRYKEHAGYAKFSADERAAFEARLAELSANYPGFDAKKWLDGAYAGGEFNKVVVLHDTEPGCNFDKTILRYADGTAADPVLLLKLNVLVRLWRRLGWTLEETDRALAVFVPRGPRALTAAKLADALKTALVYMAHLDELVDRAPVGKSSRLKLLTLWSNLSTGGKNPLYAQLFLTRSVLKNDPSFDHPLGKYLSAPNVPVKEHLVGIQGALNLTADDVERILVDAGRTLDSAELSLGLVSLLYRYALLAKGVKLSVPELIALKSITGLNPFEPLKPAGIATAADDHPLTRTLAFVDVAEAVRESGFEVEDLEFLLRHRADPVGRYRPDPAVALALVRGLGAEVQRIRSEHAAPENPAELTDEVLRQKFALIYPPEAVDQFMAMWAGTRTYEALEEGVSESASLDPPDFRSEPRISVSYDADTDVQHLSFRGVMVEAAKDELTTVHTEAVFKKLADSVQAEAKAFFDRELAEFLTANDFETLFAVPADQDADIARRERFAEAFLPFLRNRLIRRLTVQALAAELDADPVAAETLLTDTDLLEDPSAPGSPALAAFEATGDRGVSVTFHDGPGGGGAILERDTRVHANSGTPPTGTKSVRLAGYLEVPVSGVYTFFVDLEKKGAHATLRFDHLPDPVLTETAADPPQPFPVALDLMAGVPYRFDLLAGKLGGGSVRLDVKAERLPKGGIGRLTVYPASVVERVGRARALLQKVIILMQGLDLGERELRHFATHPADFGSFDLRSLPTVEEGEGAAADAAAKARFGWFAHLMSYARLKGELAAEATDLVDLLEHARRVFPGTVSAADARAQTMTDLCERIGAITRRDGETVAATAARLGIAATAQQPQAGKRAAEVAELAGDAGLRRLWDALVVVERLGARAEDVAAWTQVVSVAPDKQAQIARDLRSTAKARYEPEAWQRVAQPIFDILRRRQRDALVAFVMERGGFDRIEQLFEYFLVDPGMEPVVQTSRIQLAIASVQLFVQRCLLNLEEKVHPSALINTRYWDWMKRYRVWEANRKIFLYPENWLEPEFRDDKSYLFEELEATMLQGDMSDELAENAFFTYLKGLDRIARLDVVSMYVEEMPDPVNNVLHVVARTHTSPRKYYYRRYAHQVWMPWEPIDAEIEGDHVAAVVWRGRLHVFWVTFMEMPHHSVPANKTISELSAQQAVVGTKVGLQLHWTERFQDQWSTQEAGMPGTPIILEPGQGWSPSNALIYVTKQYRADGSDGPLRINLGGQANQAFELISKNAPPARVGADPEPGHPYSPSVRMATKYRGRFSLDVAYTKQITIEGGTVVDGTVKGGKVTDTEPWQAKILEVPGEFDVLRPSKAISMPNGEVDAAHVAALVAPFFYIDGRHTFYVEPELRQTTTQFWKSWIFEVAPADPILVVSDFLDDLLVIPEIPERVVLPRPRPWEPDDLIGPWATFKLNVKEDWVTNPRTAIEFDGELVGRDGSLGAQILVGVGRPGLGQVIEGLPVAGGGHVAGRVRETVVGGTNVPGGVMVAGEVGRHEVVVVREGRPSGTIIAVAGGDTKIAVVRGGGVNSAVLENMHLPVLARQQLAVPKFEMRGGPIGGN